jgi:hypothetical protein
MTTDANGAFDPLDPFEAALDEDLDERYPEELVHDRDDSPDVPENEPGEPNG